MGDEKVVVAAVVVGAERVTKNNSVGQGAGDHGNFWGQSRVKRPLACKLCARCVVVTLHCFGGGISTILGQEFEVSQVSPACKWLKGIRVECRAEAGDCSDIRVRLGPA